MKPKNKFLFALTILSMIVLNSCAESTPPPLNKTELYIDKVELTSFDFNHINNVYDELIIRVIQVSDGIGNVLYSEYEEMSVLQNAYSLPYDYLNEAIITNDLEGSIFIYVKGRKANFDEDELGSFKVTPSKDDEKVYSFNSSSIVPLSLKITTTSY